MLNIWCSLQKLGYQRPFHIWLDTAAPHAILPTVLPCRPNATIFAVDPRTAGARPFGIPRSTSFDSESLPRDAQELVVPLNLQGGRSQLCGPVKCPVTADAHVLYDMLHLTCHQHVDLHVSKPAQSKVHYARLPNTATQLQQVVAFRAAIHNALRSPSTYKNASRSAKIVASMFLHLRSR